MYPIAIIVIQYTVAIIGIQYPQKCKPVQLPDLLNGTTFEAYTT